MTYFRTILTGLILLTIGYSAFWYTAAFEMEDRVDAVLAGLAEEGHRMKYGAVRVDGFPYRLTIHIEAPEFYTQGHSLALKAQDFTLVTHLWTPGHYVGEARDLRVDIPAMNWSMASPLTRFSQRRTNMGTGLAIELSGNGPASALRGDTRIALNEAFVALRLGSEAPDDTASASKLYESEAADFRMRLRTEDTGVEADGRITGRWLEEGNPVAVTDWRDRGGLVDFNTIKLTAGDSELQGSGSVSLDEELRPLGAFSGVLSGNDARKLLSAFFDLPAGDAIAGPEITISAQGGVLRIGDGLAIPLEPIVD